MFNEYERYLCDNDDDNDSHNYDEDKGIMCRTSSRNHISKSVYNSNVINLKQ